VATDDKASDKVEVEETQAPERMWHKPGMVLVLVVVIVVIFVAGLFIGHGGGRYGMNRVVSYRFGGPGGGMMSAQFGANQDHIQGVVTNVNGSSLTIAGDGTTNTVQTTSSTQYIGGNSAAVNDTVSVVGSISNSAFTATRIIINP
jgi:hypothetical protein